MRVLRFNGSPTDPALLPDDTVPVPTPGRGELLVRVHAAGVTPTELEWYPTTHRPDGTPRLGAIPGHEFSGEVASVGADLDPAQVGRAVFGMNDWFAEGATAEYCLAPAGAVADKPARLSHAEAASVPIGALTAWQGLFERTQLRAGERILIHGAAGAVGLWTVQLARAAGAHVLATTSARHRELLAGLGAAEVFDYCTERFEDHVHDVDVVFDVVGGETLERSWAVLKPGGRLVSVAAENERTADPRVRAATFIVRPDHEQLREIARRLDAGELQAFVDAAVPLAGASDAYRGLVPGRLGRGKVVVTVGTTA